MTRADFHFDLPPQLIAQHPAAKRDASRLLHLHRDSHTLHHRNFGDFPTLLRPGDVLCLNDSKVIRARLRALKQASAGHVELLLIEESERNVWWCLLRPGKRVRPGTRLRLIHPTDLSPSTVEAEIVAKNDEGHCQVRFEGPTDILELLDRLGEIPLPPYIERSGSTNRDEDLERYQTVYARHQGSVAAPTAGLHFVPSTLDAIRQAGIEVHYVTLHVGAGTFAPMKADRPEDHLMHEERYQIPDATADAINRARQEGRRVVAVGTTTTRVLETAAQAALADNPHPIGPVLIRPGSGRTRLFLYPPAAFHVVGAMLTNFHLPESTLLMLVSAFASPGRVDGRERMLHAYAEAVREQYRFFSYGDAMFIE